MHCILKTHALHNHECFLRYISRRPSCLYDSSLLLLRLRLTNQRESGPFIPLAAAPDRYHVQDTRTVDRSRPLDRFLSDCLALVSHTHSGYRDSRYCADGAVSDPGSRIPDPFKTSGSGAMFGHDGPIGSQPPPLPSSSSSSSSASSGLMNSEEAIRRILNSITRVVECGGTCRLGVSISTPNDISPIKRKEKRKESVNNILDRKSPFNFTWYLGDNNKRENNSNRPTDLFSLVGTEDGTGQPLEEEAALCAQSG